jgi:hypothetical protein
MDFIRRFIEQKISRATGAEVRFGKFSFSPLSGSLEVRDLAIGTLLTIKKIEAKLAVARALKQEIVVRSLVIHQPLVSIERNAAGRLNLPTRPVREKKAATTETKKSWEFEAEKVLLLGGQIDFRDADGYHLSLEDIAGSVEMSSPTQAELVFAAASLGRRDKPVELGEARLLGNVSGGVSITLSAGSLFDLNLRTTALDAERWEADVSLAMPLMTLLALLPAAVKLPITTATGEARLAAAGSFDRSANLLKLQQFELRAGPVTLR